MPIRVCALGLCLVAMASIASLSAAPQSASGPLDAAAWLAGRWELIEGTRCTEEHWTAPSSNMLLGMSRTVDRGRTTSFEFMRIEARAGGVYFVAQPGGRPPVDFMLDGGAGPVLTFLNPGHADRLSKVIYRQHDGDTMTARIEGAEGGKTFAVDYAYRRSKAGHGSPCGAER